MIEEIDPAAASAEPSGVGAQGRLSRLPWLGLGWMRPSWLREGIVATLPAWLAAHAIMFLVSWDLYPRQPLHGLYAWDTEWYWGIARYGYDATGSLVHFFPLTSMAASTIAALTRLPVSIALFGFCWAMSLVFGATVHRLTVRECGDEDAAARAAWLSQLAPGAFVLVMGYTEPLAGALAVGYFLAVRAPAAGRGTTAWAAVPLGFLSGVARPTGVLLAIPGAVEAVRAAHASGWRRDAVLRGAAATAAPGAGLLSFLAYSRVEFGSWMLPFTEQTNALNRAGVMNNPYRTMLHVWSHDWRGHGHPAAVMAVLIIVVFAALLVPLARRLPLSYLAWTLPMFVLAIGSQDFSSLPRYLGALFPALVGAALVARRPWQWGLVLGACSALFVWTAYFALAGFAVA
ncbi:MAG TPA: hypothetical protein VFU73_04175 [Actinocrinis sp.]|nr:hypothetical protein [Actinocrinis sp.]